MLLAWFFLGVGIFFLSWAVYAQWAIGQGTPAPVAPTKQLIVEGPYKLSRNPIQLGIILYYLGLGTISDGLASGLIAFFIGFLVGITYHKLIEEKELLLRFGDEYKEYKKKTPFLFPHP
ncbi:hypothetical protein GF373_04935 [bacterium]|nr:hypothetical protein [bacterium]